MQVSEWWIWAISLQEEVFKVLFIAHWGTLRVSWWARNKFIMQIFPFILPGEWLGFPGAFVLTSDWDLFIINLRSEWLTEITNSGLRLVCLWRGLAASHTWQLHAAPTLHTLKQMVSIPRVRGEGRPVISESAGWSWERCDFQLLLSLLCN